MDADEPALWTYIVDDLLMEENEDLLNFLMSSGHKDGETTREFNDRLVRLLIQDEAHLSAAEDLLETESEVAKWYVAYLDDAVTEKIPYLNTEKLVDDLAAGGFNTTSRSLNDQLDDLIHQSVWSLLDEFTAVDPAYPDRYTALELHTMLGKYLNDGSSGDTDLDKMINAKIKVFLTAMINTSSFKNRVL